MTEFAYDRREAPTAQRWKTTVRDPRGIQTLHVLNRDGSPLEIHEAFDKPESRTTVMEWDEEDILKRKETDAKERVSRFDYDSKGNLTSHRIYMPGETALLAETAYT